MIGLARIRCRVVSDNSGMFEEVSTIFLPGGQEFRLFTDYMLNLARKESSKSVMDKTCQAVESLLRYMDVNRDCFDSPRQLFTAFASRLYTGTIGADGADPSGLYWVPASRKTVDQLVNALTNFFIWLEHNHGLENPNPLQPATRHEERIRYAAWHYKNINDFLGHISNKEPNEHTKQVRSVSARRRQSSGGGSEQAFSEEFFPEFFNRGIGGAKDMRVALRDQLIVLLMHFGGLRISEALGLWISDVSVWPTNTTCALVKIYDELEGVAPDGWVGSNSRKTRAAFLHENYARKSRRVIQGNSHLGCKIKFWDNDSEKSSIVHWFYTEAGQLFLTLWKQYTDYVLPLSRNHPYAFVNFQGDNVGGAVNISGFNHNYKEALRRIGLKKSQAEGLNPHGHRHAFKRRMEEAGVDAVAMQRAMHHKSKESHKSYASSSVEYVTEQFVKAENDLLSDRKSLSIFEDKFSDIDGLGITGPTGFKSVRMM